MLVRPKDGGAYCEGRPVERKPCNEQDCPRHRSLVNVTDVRALECAASHPLDNSKQPEWLPYEVDHPELRCYIYCRSRVTDQVVHLGYPVDDGTQCSYEDPHGQCRGGRCVPVGCDGRRDSNRRYDACGVCGGDNSTCYHYDETIRKEIRKREHSESCFSIL